MHEYYFANYRLLVDDAISSDDSMEYLTDFGKVMPDTHTFTIHMGDEALLEQEYSDATAFPIVCTTERFNLHDTTDTWTFVSLMDEKSMKRNGKYVLTCSRDYSEMTLYISRQPYYEERIQRWLTPNIPISSAIRAACEAGMTMRDGMPLHASLVEKDGYGVVFLGPSGMGKSTQAKLWVEHQGADFIIGDRPGLRRINGRWIGFGMPWDGKDGIRQQKQVPIRALISLEQAPENSIRRLTKQEAMIVLLNQVMMPMWDDAAMTLLTPLMGQLASEIPFYHLKNLPNREATVLTREVICETCASERKPIV
ncbi:MAG: hypothetical protein IJ628_11470 [Bacteroidaceae bacterium]|nr:hypothetical protein [Bacteroidaceae bacterium]